MPRRGENIYKRKDGRWEGRYIAGRRPDGQAVYRSVYADSYQKVKKKLGDEKTKLTEQRRISCHMTVHALCLEWLGMVRSSVKESTFDRYSLLVNKHIVPQLGTVRIERLTVNHISGFINNKLEKGRIDGNGGLSPRTVRNIVIVLKAVLRQAGLEYGLNSPTANLKLPKADRPGIRLLSDSNITALEANCRQTPDNGNLGLLLCMYTGMRLGEACAVRWSDIDWNNSELRIRKTVQRLSRRGNDNGAKTRLTISSPKTSNAERIIPLPSGIVGELKRLADTQDRDAFILTGLVSRFMDPRTFQNRFKRKQEELHIEPVNFHAIRHTFASQCIRKGFDVKTLSEILGHSTVQLTLDFYVHSSMEEKKKQMSGLSFLAS